MTQPKTFIRTNEELQEIAQAAQENYLFDEDTDPDGKITQGLEIITSGDIEDSEVTEAFQIANFPEKSDQWDALDIWAKALAG